MLMSVFIGAARGTILSPIVRVELTVKVFSALDTFPYRFAIVTPTLCVPTSEKVYLPIDPHLSGLFSSTLFPSITHEYVRSFELLVSVSKLRDASKENVFGLSGFGATGVSRFTVGSRDSMLIVLLSVSLLPFGFFDVSVTI